MDEQFAQMLTQALGGDQSDPLQALVLQQLSRADTNVTEDDSALRDELARCRRTVRRLGADVAAANAMTQWVAEVLGACPLCWGLNRFCRHCLGAGTPGSSEADVDRLIDWVGPALARAGLSVIPTPSHTGTETNPEGGQNGHA